MDNPVFYQASSTSPVQSVEIPNQAHSYRVSGGTSTIVKKLLQKIGKENILLNQSVSAIEFQEKTVKTSIDKNQQSA